MSKHRITGSLRVEERAKGRVWVAAYMQADGRKTRKTLGLAWVKESGRRTARGAIAWRAADGTKPDATYLTPREAHDALDALLVAERAKPRARAHTRGKTFGDASSAWLSHVEHFNGVEATTLRNYRVIVGKLHEEDFPEQLPLIEITADRLAAYQEQLLTDPRQGLARKTIRNRMLVLRGILDRAADLGWIAASPMAAVKIVAQPPADPDFNWSSPALVDT